MMCLLPCFLWWAIVSAWIYGKVLGICSKPRLALSIKKDGKGTVHFCAVTQPEPWAIPWLSLHQQVVPGLAPNTAPVGSEHSFLLSFPLRNDDSFFLMMENLSSTCARAPGCPGDVTATGQGTATTLLLSTGTPSCFQLPASASSF